MKNITRLLAVAFVVVFITAMYTTGRSQQLSFDQDVDNILSFLRYIYPISDLM